MKKLFFVLIAVLAGILFCFNVQSNLVFATNDVEIVFANKNLYNAVVSELGNDYSYSKDDSARKINMDLTEVQKVKRLELDGKDLTALNGIENFVSLEELVLNNNKISDISVLFGLENLTFLDLAHNCVTDISGINTLTSLKHLDLYDNIVRNLSSLSNMTNLEHLNLGDNNEVNVGTMTNLESLLTLANLKYFNFSRNNSSQILNYISNMTNIETLNLQENSLQDVSVLSNFVKLKELYLNSNKIEDISCVANMTQLETLYLNSNNISSLDCLFDGDTLLLSNLSKIHIYSLKNLSKTSGKLMLLKNMSKARQIELGYEIIFDSVEPHTDQNGVKYVTYDDFGARCDGVYDDMISIKDAHRFANSKGYEVKATSGKTYHIFKYYGATASLNTNTDWQNATFVIHDEDIEGCSGRFDNLFTITSNYSGITTLENPNVQINKSTKKIIGIESTLETLNERGYQKYMLMAENANKKISLRYGTSSKDNQLDCFEIDTEGNVLNDIQWNFETITKLTIYPISSNTLFMKNGRFVTNCLNGVHDLPYGRGYGKPLYFQRAFFFWAGSNVEIDNISHTLSEDRLSGSYYSFLCFRFCSDITIKNATLWAREFGVNSRSTYDLKIEQSVNFYFNNVSTNGLHDSNRWGFMATQYCKDFVFENVSVNRIDAHQVIYNLTVRNSYLGYRGFTLTGQGTLIVENTTVEAEYFINLRSDYGSTWNGNIYILNCTHKHQSNYMFKLINFSISLDDGELHDFGYEVHQPNIYIENFTVDCVNKTNVRCYPIIANYTDHNFEKANDDYWSEIIYINGIRIINSDYDDAYVSFYYTNSSKINNNFFMTNSTVKIGGDDFTHEFNMGETFIAKQDVKIEITKDISAQNTITIYKDGKLVLNNFAIEQDFSKIFAENGKYKIVLNSSDNHFGKTGEKIFEFDIKKDEQQKQNTAILIMVVLSAVLTICVVAFVVIKRKKAK